MARNGRTVTISGTGFQDERRSQVRPLRIGLFTDSNGPGYNGVNIAVEQLGAELRVRGHFVAFVAPSIGDKGKKMEKPSPYLLPSVRLPGMHPAVATGWGFSGCLRRLAQAQLDVIHVHGIGPVSLLGIYLARRYGLPLVITWHTDFASYLDHYRCLRPIAHLWRFLVASVCTWPFGVRTAPPTVNRRFSSDRAQRSLAIGTRRLLCAADCVTAPSEKVAKQLRRISFETPVHTIPSGVDPLPGLVPSSMTRGDEARQHGTKLLYVGRLAPEKGIALLLDAFVLLRRVVPDATLVLVGDFNSARGLRRRLKKAVNDPGITFTGEVGRAELAKYYREADAFVFPSTTDTQALVLHEAAHAGLPIVSVDTGLPAVLRHRKNALICEPTAKSLSDAMAEVVRLCADGKYREEAARVGQSLASRYSMKRQMREMVGLYASVISAADHRGQGDQCE